MDCAILFADVAGSTALYEILCVETWRPEAAAQAA